MWLCIFQDYSIEVFDSFKKKKDCLYWVQIINSGSVYTTSYGNSYILKKYTFLDNKGKSTALKIGPFAVTFGQDTVIHFYEETSIFWIEDADRIAKSFEVSRIGTVERMKELINYLLEIEWYEKWQFVALKINIEKLENQLNHEREENERLNTRLNRVIGATSEYKKLAAKFFKQIKDIEKSDN